jgi:hypothetical protein
MLNNVNAVQMTVMHKKITHILTCKWVKLNHHDLDQYRPSWRQICFINDSHTGNTIAINDIIL